ncbi:hypothetical protein [Streptomyces sp. SID10815]|uniref:hypothetical protein n=1 Tax=Streptomyces sp. SID10815 TaxID=2706027 RepID=UPI0013CDD410|nr:hypothetical protein [Streptomyces sp. SID10815]NEA48451.1 hypothetical protein [Streptomyces sp. SID10815]
MTAQPDPARFHLLLTSADRPVVQGWWGSEVTARRKLINWVGEYGGMPDARITLTDETTGETLAAWPGPVVGGRSYS